MCLKNSVKNALNKISCGLKAIFYLVSGKWRNAVFLLKSSIQKQVKHWVIVYEMYVFNLLSPAVVLSVTHSTWVTAFFLFSHYLTWEDIFKLYFLAITKGYLFFLYKHFVVHLSCVMWMQNFQQMCKQSWDQFPTDIKPTNSVNVQRGFSHKCSSMHCCFLSVLAFYTRTVNALQLAYSGEDPHTGVKLSSISFSLKWRTERRVHVLTLLMQWNLY